MAYSKKIWKARQGLGLNKFSIDGATPVPITNQPDSVTQQGDALSAGNLNNLEDRIAEAFDDVENEKADKATTDDLQNQIVNLNTDVDTLDAIVGGEAEIENVDPSEGQSILASSRLIHHVNLLPSGEFGLVGARDIVHEGSIVNLNPTSFRIRGIQLWDEVWEVGSINDTTGALETSTTQIRNKNKIPVMGGQSYYVLMPNGTGRTYFYDFSDNLLSVEGINMSVSAPNGASYMRFRSGVGYGPSYLDNIQIADNSLPSSVKTVYHPYNGQTVPVSISGHYVNESVYDYVTNKVVDGVLRGEVHTRVGTYTITGTESFSTTGNGHHYLPLSAVGNAKPTSSNNDVANVLCGFAVGASYNTLNASGETTDGIGVSDAGRIIVGDAQYNNWSNLVGETFYYELASETVTYGEPLRSFSVSDYCTIEPITPQSIANRADVPFSVLSKSNNGIIEQIAQNTADIADNKQILAQHEARIANLEQVSGEYAPSDLQDFSTVPTGKATYALVETLKGVSRVENNLIHASAMPSASGYGITITPNADGSITVSGTATGGNAVYTLYSVVNTAKTYLWGGCPSGGSTTKYYIGTSTSYADVGGGMLRTFPSSGAYNINLTILEGATTNFTIKPFLVDLAVYFGTSDLSFLGATDSAKLATIQSKYPELLEPRSYTAGEIKNSTYTKVTSVGVNIWDEEWEVGTIDRNTGEDIASTSNIRTKNYNPCRSGVKYYTSSSIVVSFYNINKEFVPYVQAESSDAPVYGASADVVAKPFQAPAGAYYYRFRTPPAYGTTYNNDIQICLNSYADKTTYHPHMTDQLAIPPVTLKGAGSISEVYDLETGEVTHPLIDIDLGDVSFWAETWGAGADFYSDILSNLKPPADNDSVANAICSRYVVVSRNYLYNNNVSCISLLPAGIIKFRDSSITSADIGANQKIAKLNGVILTVELATPDPSTFVTPVLNNTLRTEGGGSVFTDAEVDGQFTMGFLNL